MNAWDYGPLTVPHGQRYFYNGTYPFFWLGDTAWLLFANLTDEEAYLYLKNRADKGFTVIQACLIYTADDMTDVNQMPTDRFDPTSEVYWAHCDRIIRMAQELGLYMALLPTWGSLVKNGLFRREHILPYVQFLAKRYADFPNILWILGGDIKAHDFEPLYHELGRAFKRYTPDKLIGFHPFGRCSSTLWFAQADWIDFHLFQSGHRRYDQCEMGTWDDSTDGLNQYGEDNWKYVQHDRRVSDKPTLDGEPSYELILQGLHDDTQPYWQAKEIRRYAYWSLFAGAAGHTYGDNSVMQFYDGKGVGVSYGAKESWQVSLHHIGSGQMGIVKRLMTSLDFSHGDSQEERLVGGQRERHEHIAVFGGNDFLLAYSYTGHSFTLRTSDLAGSDVYLMDPATGIFSFVGQVTGDEWTYTELPCHSKEADVVVAIGKGFDFIKNS